MNEGAIAQRDAICAIALKSESYRVHRTLYSPLFSPIPHLGKVRRNLSAWQLSTPLLWRSQEFIMIHYW
jgi:hypothetical protein